jgi:hypothetical protein
VRRGIILNLVALSRSFGRSIKAIKKVDITLIVIVLSKPSNFSNFPVAIPAFSITISSLSKARARAQNSLTLAKEVRSTCQTSTTPCLPVVFSMSVMANSPFWILLQPRMTFEELRRTKCLAASRPRPQFAPVTITVWPLKSPSG